MGDIGVRKTTEGSRLDFALAQGAKRQLYCSRSHPFDLVCTRLSTLVPLGDGDRELFQGLETRSRSYDADEVIVTEGCTSCGVTFITSGWAISQRVSFDGNRQVFGILLPGDCVGSWHGWKSVALTDIVALTDVDTLTIMDLEKITANPAVRTDLTRAISLAAQQNERRLLDHSARLGSMRATARTAHLLLEVYGRLTGVGLVDGRRFAFPLTQEILADTLGIHLVHVNRILQRLRRAGAIELSGGELHIRAPELLSAIALGDSAAEAAA